MRALSLVVLVLICSSVLKARTCGLTISAVNELGQPTPYSVETFKGSDGRDYASVFRGLTAERLPCGKYQYRLSRSDIKTTLGKIDGSVFLVDEHQWQTVNPDPTLIITGSGAIATDREPRKEFGLEGRVKPVLIDQEPIHIRLYELFGQRHFEVEVLSDGTFTFSHQLEGKYLLVALQHGQVLAWELLAIKPSGNHPVVEITLKKRPVEFKEIE